MKFAFIAAEGLKARKRKRFRCTTMSDHDQPVAANLLARTFTAAAPNQRWVGDTTEFVTGESGKLYLAVVLDLFSRLVVGWAVSASNDRHLVLSALHKAVQRPGRRAADESAGRPLARAVPVTSEWLLRRRLRGGALAGDERLV